MIGALLDKYEVLQKVGEGGMATVYLGRHTTLGRDVAIKVLHPHLSSSARNRKRFAREARAIEHLRHDNILEIFDYSGTDCTDCYIITEFVDGETLASLMQRVGAIPSEVVALIGIHLAEALAYAHQAGILHRDLKPDNVMIRRDGTIKLMDFGIARFLDESQVTMTGALVGSPAFMSPEQAREAELDQRSDLFSLGTLLYHLVTGHLPFSGSNPSLILKNIIEGNRLPVAELAPSMSAALADVIERLMQADRAERHASASEVVVALKGCLDEIGFDARAWPLADYVLDPVAFTERLDRWLSERLVERGRADLEAGDHLAALRLFNRLLSLDEENTEVLALVQGLHGEARRRRPGVSILALAIAVGVAGSLGMWWFGQSVEARQDDVAQIRSPETIAAVDLAPTRLTSPPPPVEEEPEPEPEPAPPAPAVVAPVPSPPIRHEPTAPEPEPPPPLDPGFVEIRVEQPYPVDIYENGARIGDVRQPKPLETTAGEHIFVLRSDATLDYELRLSVAPGEVVKRVIDDLERRPVDVAIDVGFDDACRAHLNGELLGTVSVLDRQVRLHEPEAENIVVLECADGVYTRVFRDPETQYPLFPREAAER